MTADLSALQEQLQLLGNQDQPRNVVFARMPRAFESVDADRVGTERLGLERVPHGDALVDHLDAVRLERRDVLRGIAPGRFDDLHALVDDGAYVSVVVEPGVAA